MTPMFARPTAALPPFIYARGSSRQAIDEAFARQAAATRGGPFGPIGVRPIYIPLPPRAPAVVRRAAQQAATPARRPQPPKRTPADVLAAIRAHRFAIGGYATRFNVRMNGHPTIAVRRGACRAAVTDNVYLFLNHQEAGAAPSIASKNAGSLHIEESAYGLWFEAHFSDDAEGARLFQTVRRGGFSGVSWGSEGGVRETGRRDGVEVYSELGLWEISLLTPPHVPRCSGTWVMTNADARRRRRYTE